MGHTDAHAHADEIPWDDAGVTVGIDLTTSAGVGGLTDRLCAGLRVPQEAHTLDALSA